MKLKDKISIPYYTLGEEITNAITHGIGALLGIAFLVICIIVSVIHKNPMAVIASSIYGSSIIILYTTSTIYHSLKVNNAKRVFRIIDHCTIYLLIAGTYTPISLVAIKGFTGWLIFSLVWVLSILGVILNAIDIKKYKIFSLISYIGIGWIILLAMNKLINSIEVPGLWLLLIGGIIYTLGVIFYSLGKTKKYMHSIFHLFVLLATILHFWAIVFYVI